MEGLSITKLLVVGILIVLLFGTSKLRTLGADLGAALKGFKKAMRMMMRFQPVCLEKPKCQRKPKQ